MRGNRESKWLTSYKNVTAIVAYVECQCNPFSWRAAIQVAVGMEPPTIYSATLPAGPKVENAFKSSLQRVP